MESVGKILLIVGIVVALAGAVLLYAPKLPWLGKLPGDISIERDNFHVFIPLGTSLLLSVIASLVLWLISHLKK